MSDDKTILPPCFNYEERVYRIPDETTTQSTSSVPDNGVSFGAGSIISVPMLKQDSHLVPDSMGIKCTIAFVNGATANSIVGCPALTPFSRVECVNNGTVVETQMGFNQVQNMVLQLTTNAAQRLGAASAYGYNATDIAATDEDGRSIGVSATTTYNVCFPFSNILSNCNKYVPLNSGQFRFNIYVDQLTNMLGYAAAQTVTSVAITNFEICYETVILPPQERNELFSKPRLEIKSLTFIQSTQPIVSGSAGQQTLVFPLRAQSVKSIFLQMSPTVASATLVNGAFDSVDATFGNSIAGTNGVGVGGSYQFQLGKYMQYYPNKPINVAQNRAQVILELKRAATSLAVEYSKIYDKNNDLSITAQELNYATNGSTNSVTSATATTIQQPSKFIVGVHVEKLHNNKTMLSGISTMSQGINAIINIPVATTLALNATLTAVVDTVLVIDQQAGLVSAVQ